jgi:hypothetical protein
MGATHQPAIVSANESQLPTTKFSPLQGGAKQKQSMRRKVGGVTKKCISTPSLPLAKGG